MVGAPSSGGLFNESPRLLYEFPVLIYEWVVFLCKYLIFCCLKGVLVALSLFGAYSSNLF